FPSTPAPHAANRLRAAAAAARFYCNVCFVLGSASRISIEARQRARSRCAPLQSSASFRFRHSAGERTEARLQLLSPTPARRPVLSTNQFCRKLSGLSFAPVRLAKSGNAHSAWECRSCPHVFAQSARAIRRLRPLKKRNSRARDSGLRRATNKTRA